MKKDGRDFNEDPLSYEEFIGLNSWGHIYYNNFFYNFLKSRRNYLRLSVINIKMANELSVVYQEYILNYKKIDTENDRIIKGHPYPESILKKGYEAYLTLRQNFSNDSTLRETIERYNLNNKSNSSDDCSDDWAGFFS